MKKLISLLTLPLSTLLCSMTYADPSVIVESLTITADKDSINYSAIVVSPENYSSSFKVGFAYNPVGETPIEKTLSKSGLKAGSNLFSFRQTELDNISYEKDNILTFTIYLSARPRGSLSVVYRPANDGEKISFSSKDNNKGVTTSYYLENYDYGQKLFYVYDKVMFENFDDVFVSDIYYDINLSSLRFKYYRNSLKPDDISAECYLLIDDINGLFPYLATESESLYRKVKLVLNKIDDSYYFTFGELYYEIENHLISDTPREGYFPTNKLMLPKGEEDKLDHMHCFISMDIDGHTKFNVTGSFYITFMQKYMGDCSDSKYCTGINEEEEINVREKVIEVVI